MGYSTLLPRPISETFRCPMIAVLERMANNDGTVASPFQKRRPVQERLCLNTVPTTRPGARPG